MYELTGKLSLLTSASIALIDKFQWNTQLFAGYINKFFMSYFTEYEHVKSLFSDMVLFLTGTFGMVYAVVKLYNVILDSMEKRKKNKIKGPFFK